MRRIFRETPIFTPDRERCYLLYLYGKDEAEDLTASEKKIFKELVTQIKGESR